MSAYFITSNIWKLYLHRAIGYFLVTMPIITLFYRENGLSMQDIFMIQSIFSFSLVCFEIPTGYFSDVFGRKKTMILGSIIGIFGMSIYCLASGFWGFLLAELTLGIGSSFLSGTNAAMLYDTLVQSGKVDEHKKISGRMQAVGGASEALASLLGGFLAVISLRFPFYCQLILLIASLPLVFSLKEPERQKHDNRDGAIRGMLKIVRYSLTHHEIPWIILFTGALGSSTLVMTWISQSYFTYVSLPLVYFGIVWAILNLSIVGFSLIAHDVELFLGRKKSLILLASLPALGYFGLSFTSSIFGIGLIFFFYFARAFGIVVLNDYVNRVLSSDIRATVLSIQALSWRVVFAIIGPIIGWMSDVYSLSLALFASGAIFFLLFLISLIFLARNRILDI